MDDHQSVLDLDALHAQADRLPAQAHDVEQLPGGARQRTEAVLEPGGEGLEGLLVLRRVELAVELQAFGLLGDVVVGQRGFDLDLDVGVVDEVHLLNDLLRPSSRPATCNPSARSSAIASFMIFW